MDTRSAELRAPTRESHQAPTSGTYRRNRRRQLLVQLAGWAVVAGALAWAVRS